MRHDIPTEKQQEEEEEQEEEQKGEQEEEEQQAQEHTQSGQYLHGGRLLAVHASAQHLDWATFGGVFFVPASIKAAEHILMKENLFAVLWSCVHRCCRPILRKENLFAAGFNIVLVLDLE
jgi:hypothetical protein